MAESRNHQDEKPSRSRRWRLVYIAVIANTVLVILLLHFFSARYSG